MTDSEMVHVLLAEYDTLRTEILQRLGNRFQFLTITGALGAFLLVNHKGLLAAGACVAVVAAGLLWFWLGELVVGCSRRLAEIEREVNTIAGRTLLNWESTQAQRGVFHRFHRLRMGRKQPPSPKEK